MVELSNDCSRSFSDNSTSKEGRDLSAREVLIRFFVILTFLSARSADALDMAYWQAAEHGVKHCQIRKARQLKQNSVWMSYFPTASRKCFVAIYWHVFTIFVVGTVIITRWFFILRIVTFCYCSSRPDSL